jgi:hypothetical protein
MPMPLKGLNQLATGENFIRRKVSYKPYCVHDALHSTVRYLWCQPKKLKSIFHIHPLCLAQYRNPHVRTANYIHSRSLPSSLLPLRCSHYSSSALFALSKTNGFKKGKQPKKTKKHFHIFIQYASPNKEIHTSVLLTLST